MLGDGSKKTSKASPSIEELLKDLSDLERCTLSALQLVHSVLDDASHEDLAKTRRRTAAATKTPSKTNGSTKSSESSNHVALARNAQRIVKVCLTTLSDAYTTKNTGLGPESQDIAVSSPSNLKRPSVGQSETKAKARKTASTRVLTSSCSIALNTWTRSFEALSRDQLPIVKTRYNLVCRMLDLNLMTESLQQLEILRTAIYSILQLSSGLYCETQPFKDASANLLLYDFQDELTEDSLTLIMNVQGCAMKYIYLMNTTMEDSVLRAFIDDHGPLRWCKELRKTQPKQAEAYLLNVNRYLLRFVPRIPSDSQLLWHILSIEVMLDLKDPEWQTAMECYCRRIPSPCTSESFERAHALAERFLERYKYNSATIKNETILVLIERMAKLAQGAGNTEALRYWSQQGISNAPESSNLSFHIDFISVSISQAGKGGIDPSIALPDDCIAKLHSGVSEQEISLSIKSINNLRWIILNRLRSFGDDFPVLSRCLRQLLVIIRTLASTATVWKTNTLNLTASKTIEAWTSVMNIKGFEQNLGERRQGFEICLSIAETLGLPECTSQVAVIMYNNGGILYNQQEYQSAAELLELCFTRANLATSDTKKLEYLWSSYTLCGNYQKAYSWLQEALSNLLVREQFAFFRLPEETAKKCPEIYRTSSKIIQILTDHLQSTSLPIPADLAAPTKGCLLELYLLHLKRSKPSRRMIELVDLAVEALKDLYTTEVYPWERFRTLSVAFGMYRAYGDRDRTEACRDLVQDYKEWFRRSQMPEIAIVCEARFLAHSMDSSVLSLDNLKQLLPKLSGFIDRLASTDTIIVSTLMEALGGLQQTIFRLDLALDCLKISEIMLYTNTIHGLLDTTELLRLEMFTAELYLRCGYDGRAILCMKRAKKISQSKVTDSVLLTRSVELEMMLQIGIGSKSTFATQATLLNQVLKAKHDPIVLLDCQAIALICLSLHAEDTGSLGSAIQFQLEALSLIRRSLHRRGRRYGGEAKKASDDELVSDLAAMSLDNRSRNSAELSEDLVNCLKRLALLHERTGSLKDSMFYWEEAKSAALGLKYQHLINSILVRASRTYFHVGKEVLNSLDDSNLRISQNPLQQAEALFAQAERLALADSDVSIGLYETAKQTLISSLDVEHAPMRQHVKSNGLPNTRTVKKKGLQPESGGRSSKLIRRYITNALCALYDLHRRQGHTEAMSACVAELEVIHDSDDQDDLTAYILGSSRLHEAEDLLDSDPIYGALQDSALSLPSVCNVSLQAPTNSKGSRKAPSRQKASNGSSDQIKVLLNQTKDSLNSYFEQCLIHGESYSAYTQSNLFVTLNLLHSALLDPRQEIALKSSSSNYLLECSRALALSRERDRTQTEVRSGADLVWEESLGLLNKTKYPAQSTFQADYIDNIPARWTVVSIGLSSNGKDLIVTRMQRSKISLILRLPMSRHSSRDIDEDTFAYEDAKSELKNIIKLSDEAAQGAKDIKDKQDKAAWWSLRQELDSRLKVLLDNIEHCWLGGFRGALGMTGSDPDCLEQFRLSFAKIILKHVPLQKSRPFDLDSRILDLFTDLGPIDEASSLELLEDLLYFVLDIYQFHGESIAYDEIDIDQMVVDVQSVLNSHHERSQPLHGDEHMVLILDKSVHMFPWESLPCLRYRSVSRVPSLAVLKLLLDGQEDPERTIVERRNGRFVLNPGQDLKATEKSFGELLTSLPGWSGIIARKPEESEIISYLESSSIYMYFGHGGGEQYARANKIKKVSRCAVAILMGCSSGALKDQGVYDPWGTPYTYMVAACPCLVANLWDVTDKDIDRFSHEMLAHWSLLPGKEPATSICAAVAKSRDECILKYLNGAAPVVYGLPVWLSQDKSKLD